MPDETVFFSCLKTFFLGQEACKGYSISEDEFVFVRENVEHSDFSIIFSPAFVSYEFRRGSKPLLEPPLGRERGHHRLCICVDQ